MTLYPVTSDKDRLDFRCPKYQYVNRHIDINILFSKTNRNFSPKYLKTKIETLKIYFCTIKQILKYNITSNDNLCSQMAQSCKFCYVAVHTIYSIFNKNKWKKNKKKCKCTKRKTKEISIKILSDTTSRYIIQQKHHLLKCSIDTNIVVHQNI